ncbi:hypothetical protein EDC04DRAFT_2887066 [Pisolithus marmoratus]|nr:hypothetical protein EDC04DRAFT_2887066 [Pisolithus marmoratus]
MDAREKENFIRSYVEQQRAYLSAYCREDPIDDDDQHPSGSPTKVPSSGALGFDTPVLQPRTLQNSAPPPKLHGGQRLQGKKCPRRAEPQTTEKQLSHSSPPPTVASDADKENEKPPARKRSSKKTRTPPSDCEHEARLAERRERKRQKREIVRSPSDGDDCRPRRPCGKLKTMPAKKKPYTSNPGTFALLHGFSATNVKKDRLTLKPSLQPLGVFFKGKASAKTKVFSSKKQAPCADSFSELAFLNKAKAINSKDVADSDASPSAPQQSSHPPSDRDDIPNHRSTPDKDAKNQKSVGDQLQSRELPEEHQSIVWDIESQNGCLSDAQNSSAGSAAKASASVVVNVRTSRWFAPANTYTAPDRLEIESKPSKRTPSKRGLLLSRSLPCVVESDKADPVLLRDREGSSLHPSHSASQTEYFSQPCPVSATATRRFVQETSVGTQMLGQGGNSVTFDVDSIPGEFSPPSFDTSRGLAAHEIRDGWTAIEVSSQPPAMFPTDVGPFCVTSVAHEQPGTAPSYVSFDDRGYYETVDDRQPFHTLNEPIGYPPSDEIGFYDCEAPWYGDDPSMMDDLGVEPNFDFWPESHVEDRELTDAADGQDPDTIKEAGLDDEPERECEVYPTGYRGSVADDMDDYCVWQHDDNEHVLGGEQPQALNFQEGRALLLGISTPPRLQGPNGLFRAELDVATRLRDHWQRQRL